MIEKLASWVSALNRAVRGACVKLRMVFSPAAPGGFLLDRFLLLVTAYASVRIIIALVALLPSSWGSVKEYFASSETFVYRYQNLVAALVALFAAALALMIPMISHSIDRARYAAHIRRQSRIYAYKVACLLAAHRHSRQVDELADALASVAVGFTESEATQYLRGKFIVGFTNFNLMLFEIDYWRKWSSERRAHADDALLRCYARAAIYALELAELEFPGEDQLRAYLQDWRNNTPPEFILLEEPIPWAMQ